MEEITDILFDKNSFLLQIEKGSVLPTDHPNYFNNRISILISNVTDLIENKIQIEKEIYTLTEDKINKIKDLITNIFNDLLNITQNQNNNDLVGDGMNIFIKFQPISLIIDSNCLNSENKIIIDDFVNKIILIIAGVPECLYNYVYINQGKIFPKQKLPKELEEIFEEYQKN